MTTHTSLSARGALMLTLLAGAAPVAAGQTSAPPTLDFLEQTTLTPHHRVSVRGKHLDQAGQVQIAGIPAFVVPIPGTNPVKMNAYVPADVPYGPCDVTVTTTAGTSNALTLDVVPRAPKGRLLWRFFMNNQLMLHRPAIAADGTIYARSQAGDLIAISPQGELKWFLQLGPDLQPTIDIGPDGTIYTGDSWPTVIAVNPDGTIKWTWADPSPNQGIVAGPNVGPDGNVYVVTHTPGSGVVSLDPAGNVRWTGPDSPYGPIGQVGQEITFSDSQLFFCVDGVFDSFAFDGGHVFRQFTITQLTSDSPQTAVGPNGDSYVEEWSRLRSHAPDGDLNWTAFPPNASYLRQPDVGPDGTIYVMRNLFNTFHALHPDGTAKWSIQHPYTLLNPAMSPTNDTLVIGGGGGTLGHYFFQGIDPDGAVRWQTDLPAEVLGPFETVTPFPQGRARFTPDGSVAYVMASSTNYSGGHCYLYALQIAESVSVGHGMAGSQGVPQLVTSGPLEPSTPLQVTLTGANPNAIAYLVVGFEAQATPLLGGVVVPRPDQVIQEQTDGAGQVQFTVTWPSGIAPETTVLLQYWVHDPAGPQGWVASNAVSLITP